MWWADTTTGILKIRNSANDAWVELLQLDGTLTLEDGSASSPALAFRDDLNTGVYSSAADKFNVATGGVERMELGTQTVFNEDGADVDFRIEGDTDENLFRVDAGNNRIIIGASSATAGKFAIEDSAGNNLWLVGSSSDDTASVSFSNNADDAYRGRIEVDQSNGMKFQVAGSERVRIDTSGRLLIGTTSARSSGGSVNAHLQLEGTTSQGAELLIIRNTADTFSPTLGLVKTRGTSVGSNTAVQDNDVIGKIQFRGADGSDIFSVGASIFARVNGTPSDGTDMPAELVFATTADGASSPTERMSIDSSGNLAIGGFTPPTDLNSAVMPSLFIDSNQNSISAESGALYFTQNAYFNSGGSYEYVAAAAASQYRQVSGEHIFANAASGSAGANFSFSERMRIDLQGRFLVGTSTYKSNLNASADSSGQIAQFVHAGDNINGCLSVFAYSGTTEVAKRGAKLQLHRARSSDGSTNTILSNGDLIGTIEFKGNDGASFTAAAKIEAFVDGGTGTDDMPGAIVFSTSADGSGAPTERMRIDSSGRMGLGKADPDHHLDVSDNTARAGIRVRQHTNNTANTYSNMILRHAAATSGQNAYGILFQNSGGSEVGRIDYGQSTTQYRTSSDYRLKENVVTISDGITRLKTLKPYRFNWIAEKGQPKVDGFFAHEVTAVPEAISGTKDEVDSDNNPVYQGIDLSKLVPLLTAALQEAITKIEVLETKVAALEAA